MKRIKLIVAVISLLASMGALVIPSALAVADTPQGVVCSTLDNGDASCASQPTNGVSLDKAIGTAVNLLSLVVGIIAVIMMIISGIKFITANGDSAAVKSARHTLTYALVGIIVVAMAQAVVKFVLRRVTL